MSIIFVQSKECELLLALAKENKLKIAIPQYSLVEVEGKAFKKIRKRGEQLQDMVSLLNKISESSYNREDAKIAKNHITAILQRVPEEEGHISEIMDLIRKDIVVIPHSETILVNADLRFQSAFPPFKVRRATARYMKHGRSLLGILRASLWRSLRIEKILIILKSIKNFRSWDAGYTLIPGVL